MPRLKDIQLSRSGAIDKKSFIQVWDSLPQNLELDPSPVAYKHKGTTIDQDGIRITGGLRFIESVLSRLKPLLAAEGDGTRLQIACSEITDKITNERIPGRFRASIQVHERGEQATHYNRVVSSLKVRKAQMQ